MHKRVNIVFKKSDVLRFFLYSLILLAFIPLPILAENVQFAGRIYAILQIALAPMLIIFYIAKKKFNSFWIIMLVFFAILGLTSLLNGNKMLSVLQVACQALGLCMFFSLAAKENKKVLLTSLWCIFFIYIVSNFFSMMIFPKGMYIRRETYTENWILGYKNSHIKFYLIFIVTTFLLNYYRKRKYTLISYVVVLAMLGLSILAKSGNSIIGACFMVVALLFANILTKRHYKIFSAFKLFITCIAMNFLVVVVRIQNYFSFFLENIMHKDVTFTGRTLIWDESFRQIAEKPLLGHGNEPAVYYVNHAFYAASSHNFILDMLYRVGIVGVALFAVLIAISLGKIMPNENKPMSKGSYAIFVTVLCFLILSVAETYGFAFACFVLTIGYNTRTLDC